MAIPEEIKHLVFEAINESLTKGLSMNEGLRCIQASINTKIARRELGDTWRVRLVDLGMGDKEFNLHFIADEIYGDRVVSTNFFFPVERK